MISKFAIDEIESMQDKGLNPTPRDIIRLNALALKVHAAQGKAALDTAYLLPRVAVIKGGRSFREPSIGHEVWIDEVMRFVDRTDHRSVLAVYCFALSRSAAELPRLDDLEKVNAMIRDFCKDYRDITVRQLDTAIDYVRYGADWVDGEEPTSDKKTDDDSPVEDDEESALASETDLSIAIGVLRDGVTVLSGLTLAEMKEMPRREVVAAIKKAGWIRGKQIGSDEETVALGNFYKTRDDIINRLTKEQSNGSAASV